MFITCRVCSGQNLVPNSSFEVYDTCPDAQAQVHRCVGWENWLATSDYYNACAPCCAGSVPYNLHYINPNFQVPHSGDAYMGFFNYWTRAYVAPYPYVRDHFAIQLAQPMQVGSTYNFSMNVNLTDYFNGPCASNKIGVKFTTQSFAAYDNQIVSPLVNNTASIYFDTLITDTANWVTLSSLFIADSTYQYIVIGNFFDDFNTDTLILNTAFSKCYSYYFVDDVSVSLATGVNEPNKNIFANVYPSPFNDVLNIQVSNKELSDVVLYDIASRKLLQQKFINSTSLNTEQLAKGIYLYMVRNRNTVIKKGKVVKD